MFALFYWIWAGQRYCFQVIAIAKSSKVCLKTLLFNLLHLDTVPHSILFIRQHLKCNILSFDKTTFWAMVWTYFNNLNNVFYINHSLHFV